MRYPESLLDNVLFLCGVINNRISRKINHSFRNAGIDITLEQFAVMALLWYKEGYNQQEIADTLKRDKTTITRVLGKMFDKNLLVKVPDRKDSRNNLIYLTKLGKDLQHKCVDITGNQYNKLVKDITDEEITITLNVLNKILRNIE